MTPDEIREFATECDEHHDYLGDLLLALADVVEAAEAHNGSGQTKYELQEALARVEALKP